MIQEIQPSCFNNTYQPREPRKSDVVFSFEKDKIFLKEDYSFFHIEDYAHLDELYFLFSVDDTQYYLHPTTKTNTTMTMQEFRRYMPRATAFAVLTAYHIASWRKENHYCGCCGREMVDDEKERARRCPNCNHIIYPKISPAVIVGIVNDKGQIVLTKYKDRPSVGYALVAGFCEIGETIEDTIKREVKEEVGLKVKDITYYKSQPWALSSSLLLGFFCRVDGSEEIYVDGIELKEANWFSKEDIPEFNDTSSLTAEMKRIFMKGNIPW